MASGRGSPQLSSEPGDQLGQQTSTRDHGVDDDVLVVCVSTAADSPETVERGDPERCREVAVASPTDADATQIDDPDRSCRLLGDGEQRRLLQPEIMNLIQAYYFLQ